MKQFHILVILWCTCRAIHHTENEMYRRFNSINDIFKHFNSENEILRRFNSENEIFRRFSADKEKYTVVTPTETSDKESPPSYTTPSTTSQESTENGEKENYRQLPVTENKKKKFSARFRNPTSQKNTENENYRHFPSFIGTENKKMENLLSYITPTSPENSEKENYRQYTIPSVTENSKKENYRQYAIPAVPENSKKENYRQYAIPAVPENSKNENYRQYTIPKVTENSETENYRKYLNPVVSDKSENENFRRRYTIPTAAEKREKENSRSRYTIPRVTEKENARSYNSQIEEFRKYISTLERASPRNTNLPRVENSEKALSNRINLGNEIIQKVNSGNFPQSEQDSLAKRYLDVFILPENERPTVPVSSFKNSSTSNNNLLEKYKFKLKEISKICPKDDFYNSYNPKHRLAVHKAASLYNDFNDFESVMQMSEFLKFREEMHPQVWYVSLRTAQLARMPQTLAMERPHPIYLFPTRFFPESIMKHVPTDDEEECVVLDESIGEDNGDENKLWYFREDVQMNAHHWIWHLLYPLNSTQPIDRRGEAFYHFHHEIMARYISERIANGLDPPAPFNMQLDSVVEEPFYPHLEDGVSTRAWAARPPNQSLSASLNETLFQQLYNLTVKRDRIVDSLLAGFVFSGNRLVPIHTIDNTNELGELTEASRQSINPDFYGASGYHNQGHLILANLIGDSAPGTLGVMADETTALRDVIFYRWHRLLDMLFQAYKELHLSPYSLYEGDHALIFQGIEITDIQVLPENGGTVNSVHTFWNTRRFHIEGGLDFNGRNTTTTPPSVRVCAKHLDHEEFNYHMKIINKRKVAVRATIRIYLAPRYKSSTEDIRYTMEEQRSLFFSLDSFVTRLKPGSNLVIRRSVESTLTAPWPKSIQELRQNIRVNGSIIDASESLHCECGFPHHLLLPRGTEDGMTFDLFAMATDAEVDERVKPYPQPKLWRQLERMKIPECTPSHIHCGLPGKRYPDSKPLGYPFDRKPYLVTTHSHSEDHPAGRVGTREVTNLEEFVSHVPNMANTLIVIVHENVQVDL